MRVTVITLISLSSLLIFFRWKTELALKRQCNFSHEKSNELTDQQDMFYYNIATKIFFSLKLDEERKIINAMHVQRI